MANNWLELDGKTVIVTGGNSGIGLHIADHLKEQGANVVVADLSVETGTSVYGKLNVKTDVTSIESIEAMVEKAVEKFGKIDVLVNNAGMNLPRLLVDVYSDERKYEIDEDSFNKMTAVNQKGMVFTTQAVVRNMLKNKVEGTIINISSESGMEGSVGQSIYSATKGATNSYTRSWAKELGRFNIRVVGVAPGINEPTPMGNAEHVAEFAYARGVKASDVSPDYQKTLPLGRVGKLDEIADLVTYLLSDRSSYITGTIINITGGKSRG